MNILIYLFSKYELEQENNSSHQIRCTPDAACSVADVLYELIFQSARVPN